ncbi:unnamed protein product [Auanema sp. JU1783]|nr:unnamed protein product [Auanema sp. JU1783]
MIYLLLPYLFLSTQTVASEQDLAEVRQRIWNSKILRDFVRGKGHGSVARLSLQDALSPPNSFDDEDHPLLDLNDPSVMSGGGIYNAEEKSSAPIQQPQRGFGQIIMPTSIIAPASYLASMKRNNANPTKIDSNERPVPIKSLKMSSDAKKEQKKNESSLKGFSEPPHQATTPSNKPKKIKGKKKSKEKGDEPSLESFEELAGLFQQFITKRKTKGQFDDVAPQISISQKRIENVMAQTSAVGQWESMDPTDVDIDEEQFMPMEKDAWEQKMKQLSEQLSLVLKQIRQTKDQSKPAKPLREKPIVKKKPVVTILRNGSAEQMNDGSYTFLATITLVQDEGKNILIDTGLGTDINGRTLLLNKLSSLGLAPPNIDIVVTTHGHPDHIGGINDFPDATHYQGWYVHKGTRFNLSDLFETDRLKITSNVNLIRTPGHSSDDLSIVVRDEQSMGTVTISGDVFIRKEDIDYPIMWQPLSANETQQALSRKKIMCSDTLWIVPGHGPPFLIDNSMKNKFKC